MSRKSITVIGAGFIGSHVARTLAGRGHDVTLASRRPPDVDGVRCVVADAGSERYLLRFLEDADLVIYSAGGLLPAASNADPARDVELSLPPILNVLESLRSCPETRLVFLSSGGTIYGNPTSIPVAEGAPTEPISSYGVLKLAAERYIGMYCHLYGIAADVLRCSNIYGPGQPAGRGQGVIAELVYRTSNDVPFQLYGSGDELRDYLYVHDLTQIIVELANTPRPDGLRTINVGSGVGHSLNDLIATFEQVRGRPVRIEAIGARDCDVRNIVLDIAYLRSLIDFQPTPIAEGISATVTTYEQRRATPSVSS